MNTPWLDPSIIAKKHNDGIIGQSILFQALEHFPNRLVHTRNGIQVASPFRTHNGMIRIVRRGSYIFYCGNLFMVLFTLPFNPGLAPGVSVINIVFTFQGVHLSKERLILFQLFPLTSIIEFTLINKIKVKFS